MSNLVKGLVVVSSVLTAGCASVGLVSPVSYDIRGSVQEDSVYMSPGGSFRVRMPHLLKPGARVVDQVPRPNALWVSFSDDLCREFIAIEYPGEIGSQSLDAWVDSTVIPELMKSDATILDRKTLQTKNGQAVFIRYRVPRAAPCTRIRISEGEQVAEKPDAEIGVYNLHVGGYFYRLMYVVGDDPALDGFGAERRPLEKLLSRFVEGFEILQVTPK